METSTSTGHHARGEVILGKGPAFVLTWNPPKPGLARGACGVQQSILRQEGLSRQPTVFYSFVLPRLVRATLPDRFDCSAEGSVWSLRCVSLHLLLRHANV